MQSGRQMSKKGTVVVVALAMLASGAYFFRDQLQHLADQVLSTDLAKKRGAEVAQSDNAKGDRKGGDEQATSGKEGKGKRGGGAGGAAPVTVAEAVAADMPVILSAPGTVEAMATVAVKPRVDGQIMEVGFKEGDLVNAGDVLFRLDDRLVKAQIKQAEAAIAKDQASLRDAEAILERKESLFQKKYASEATTETARQQVEVLKASIEAGKALLEAQRTQLDYLTIKAPITGRTGSVMGKLGQFVRSADTNALVTINQTKPIAVGFALPQSNLDSLKAALRSKATAVVTVPLTKPVKTEGALFFVDNQVDKTTGTVTAKVQVENADEVLWPGLAVGVELTVEVRKDMVAVPASSVLPSQMGLIAWVVDSDNRVSIRRVTLDRTIGQTSYLSAGVKPGERVVTDGQTRLTPNGQVSIRDSRGAETGPASAAKGGGRTKGADQRGGQQQEEPGAPRTNGRS
jgi:multidrug efflux system membrane fusion protein